MGGFGGWYGYRPQNILTVRKLVSVVALWKLMWLPTVTMATTMPLVLLSIQIFSRLSASTVVVALNGDTMGKHGEREIWMVHIRHQNTEW